MSSQHIHDTYDGEQEVHLFCHLLKSTPLNLLILAKFEAMSFIAAAAIDYHEIIFFVCWLLCVTDQDSLEAKYIAEDALSKNFLVSNFTNYKMTDSRPVMKQYNELLGILGRFTQHKMNMDEAIKDELTLVELDNYLRIEESYRVQDSDKPKGNNVADPSVVNMVEHNNSFRYNDNNGKRKNHDKTWADPNKKAKPTCWKCAKLVTLKGIAKVLMLDDDVAWWVELGTTVHVLKDRCWFKTYDLLNDGSILHMGYESTALDEEDKEEEEHLAPADPSDVSTDDLETMKTVNQGMSVEEIKRVVAQRVANAIEDITIYEMETNLSHKSMSQTERQKEKVAENASNKRKWEGNHNGSSNQQNKGHKVPRAHTAWSINKKAYAGSLPLCNQCKFHHNGPCTAMRAELVGSSYSEFFTKSSDTTVGPYLNRSLLSL
nr:hypothetical protein [Tanacetum cinerariifolium]